MKTFAIALLAFAMAAPGARAGERWDLASAWPAGNFHVQNAMKFSQAVAKATNGDVQITVHPGGALGLKGPEMLVAVRDGQLAMADIQMNQQVGENRFWGIESLPYLATGYGELRKLQRHTRPQFDKLAGQYGQKILYIVPWPPQGVFSKVAFDSAPSQLKGLKIRTIDKNGSDFFGKIGAVPLQMPWGDVVPALATGALDGVATSSTSGVDGKFWEFLAYCNRLNWQMNSQMVSVNLRAWNKLKPEQQKTIEGLSRKMEGEFWAVSEKEDEKNIALLTSRGMKVAEPSAALKATLNKIGAAMWDDYAASTPMAKPVLSVYRKEVGK
ncbi:MAG: TRAP transporter substrate-binding protein [Burkholderiales bacterium]